MPKEVVLIMEFKVHVDLPNHQNPHEIDNSWDFTEDGQIILSPDLEFKGYESRLVELIYSQVIDEGEEQ